MPRPKGSKNKNIEKIKCNKCEELRNPSQFYKSNSPLFNGYAPICKICVRNYVDENDMNTVFDMLRQLDIAFDPFYWEKAKESESDTFGKYVSMANTLNQLRGLRWRDSVLDKTNNVAYDNEIKEIDEDINSFNPKKYKPTNVQLEKWGYGYKPEEYYYFEKKYEQLKNNYIERTAMHTEALLTYIRYRVKEELATAAGDSKEAKEWGTLAKEAATAAKINPSQLSKADLSEGLDSFGQLTRSVEQAVDIIEILPKFKERPQDKVDVTLWCYINYVRDLKGLPPVEYKDIYAFYEERKREYEAMIENGDNNGEL